MPPTHNPPGWDICQRACHTATLEHSERNPGQKSVLHQKLDQSAIIAMLPPGWWQTEVTQTTALCKSGHTTWEDTLESLEGGWPWRGTSAGNRTSPATKCASLSLPKVVHSLRPPISNTKLLEYVSNTLNWLPCGGGEVIPSARMTVENSGELESEWEQFRSKICTQQNRRNGQNPLEKRVAARKVTWLLRGENTVQALPKTNNPPTYHPRAQLKSPWATSY